MWLYLSYFRTCVFMSGSVNIEGCIKATSREARYIHTNPGWCEITTKETAKSQRSIMLINQEGGNQAVNLCLRCSGDRLIEDVKSNLIVYVPGPYSQNRVAQLL